MTRSGGTDTGGYDLIGDGYVPAGLRTPFPATLILSSLGYYNGGSTQTMPPTPGSPSSTPATTSWTSMPMASAACRRERQQPRRQRQADLGAVETDAPVIMIYSGGSQHALVGGFYLLDPVALTHSTAGPTGGNRHFNAPTNGGPGGTFRRASRSR